MGFPYHVFFCAGRFWCCQWRIRFDPPDAETLTVLVGDSKMLIGDVSYRLPSPDFLDILEVKYNYFSERLYFDTKHTVLQD